MLTLIYDPEVEAGRKPRPGLKHPVMPGRTYAITLSRQGENPDRD